MKNSFYLVIPKQEENPLRIKEYQPKPLQHWLNELPAANPGLATRLAHDFLLEFNTLAMSAELRMAALEQVRPTFFAIEDNLRSRLIKSGFPKEENEYKVFNVLVSIEKEMTLGYWIALKELSQRNSGWFQGKQLPLALYRCIHGLSEIMISHYLMRMPIPDWIWIDLHSLYTFSITQKKDTARVSSDPFNPAEKNTPENCYKQILLLSLTSPHGLMPKEILMVYQFLKSISSQAIIKNTPVSGKQLQCVIPIEEDRPPYFLKEGIRCTDTAALFLDLNRLYRALEQKAKLANNGEGRFSSVLTLDIDQAPTYDFLEYLFHRWSGHDLTSAPLFGDRLDRYVTLGLVPTHERVNDMTNAGENNTELFAQTSSECLLASRLEQPGILSIGRLISIRKTDRRDTAVTLGIINQIQIEKQTHKVLFGIQHITSQCTAITLNPLDSSKKEEPLKALFYTSAEEGNEKCYLITDNFMLKNNGIARIYWKQEDYPISLNHRKNIGLGYWQFQCQRIMEKEKPSLTRKGYDFI